MKLKDAANSAMNSKWSEPPPPPKKRENKKNKEKTELRSDRAETPARAEEGSIGVTFFKCDLGNLWSRPASDR